MSAHPGQIESARIRALKAEATELKAQQRLKHHEALKRIAAREGFSSWEELLAADEADCDEQPTEQQVRDAERRAVIYGRPR